MPTTSITYDIRTSESVALYSDAAERGYWMPGGWTYPTPDDPTEYAAWLADDYDIQNDDIRDVAECAIFDGYRVEEGTRWLVWGGESGDWAETDDGEQGIMTRHLHKGDDITDEEWSQIKAWVAAGRVPDCD